MRKGLCRCLQISWPSLQVDLLRDSSPAVKQRNLQDGSEEASKMPRKSSLSIGFAIALAILTISAIGGMISMIIVFEIEKSQINMTEPPPTVPTTMAPLPTSWRLPRYLIPERYEITIQVDLYTRIVEEVNVTTPNQTLHFHGNSTVHFQCHQNTNVIFLHSLGLKVSSPRVINKDTKEEMKVISLTHQENGTDFLVIQIENFFKRNGNYSLFLAFKGEISEYLDAFYVSRYAEFNTEAENVTIEERFLAATDLEPTGARQIFPCFDEPDMKAVFQLKVIHRRKTKALANTAGKAPIILNDEWQMTLFEDTPKMSSYLFAFTVSEFEDFAKFYDHRVDIKTYARPEAIKAHHADYAAKITAKILDFYEKHLNQSYGMRKLDQIALPDLNFAAMENWGLITYQEPALLYVEGVSSLLQKEAIAEIIAHELAHQWFGNSVTMKWWNEVWLNEGFATYMSYLAVDQVEPLFQIKEISIMNDLHKAFEDDALQTSHPLSQSEEFKEPSEILGMFDAISYCKGAMVLRMLADHMVESIFDQGVRDYLKNHTGGNVEQDDLWDVMDKAYKIEDSASPSKVIKNWTTQIGYPVLTINTTNGECYQKHFLYNSSAVSNQTWYIPIRYKKKISSNPDYYILLNGTSDNMSFIAKKGEWLLANINCTGYYRVNYNLENWKLLMGQLETEPDLIPLMNRGQLIDDAFNLARAKLVNVTLPLEMTRFLHKEKAFLPWESAVRNLEYFVLMFDRSEVYGPMQIYLRHQVEELYNHFKNHTDNSTVPEDHSSQHMQITAIETACSTGLPDCIEMAKEKFAEWMDVNGTNNIHPNLRSTIYCQALAAGEKKEWEFAFEKFQDSFDSSEREQLRRALSCTKQTWLLCRYLDYTLDPDKIRLMEATSIIIDIAQNAEGQALAWDFMRAHWNYFSQGNAPQLIERVTRRFSTQFELQQLERFKEVGGYDRHIDQAIEQTKINIQWVKENKNIILEWFEKETAHPE
ncbi:aminopeptidase N-like [Cyprinodon tularosa]|uniref:aminopeptidase N-like n=1 Tax=Cyprinodon tularosa TaxID=77115 RepID=UPI0018E1F3FC|nr:aminopeptidase N-like [Cyprinodon tularosa]XP_038130386.1 aminopeptidase N-like [Cyprinodon tularosa]